MLLRSFQKMTEKCFKKCVGKPGQDLDSSEQVRGRGVAGNMIAVRYHGFVFLCFLHRNASPCAWTGLWTPGMLSLDRSCSASSKNSTKDKAVFRGRSMHRSDGETSARIKECATLSLNRRRRFCITFQRLLSGTVDDETVVRVHKPSH